MKKRLGMLLFPLVSLILAHPVITFADSDYQSDTVIENSITSDELITFDEYSDLDENGDTIIFENKEDYDFYIKNEKPKKIHTLDYSTGTSWKTTITSSVKKNNLWIGYHSGTPSWSKASSYTLTKNQSYSVSGSYKYDGSTINIGFTYSKGVNTTIPANKNKNSRLGLWGDFTFRTIKTTEYKNGKPTGNVKYRKDSIRHDYYINPKYQ